MSSEAKVADVSSSITHITTQSGEKLKLFANVAPAVTLNTGNLMPILGIGSFLSEKVTPAVEYAILKAGYRHVDCAPVYENEDDVGKALATCFNAGIKREELFITSKLSARNMHPSKIRGALEKTLSDLGLKYLDLYLIHQCIPCHVVNNKAVALKRAGFSMLDVYRELEKAYKDGLVKNIGVSNFNVQLLNDLCNACEIVPAVNQVERHPYLVQPGLVKFCRDYNIVLTAYGPIGAPGLMGDKFNGKDIKPLLQNDTVLAIAKKHNKSPAQVLLRWSVEDGVVTIPKSEQTSRVLENSQVFDFSLSKDEFDSISALDCNLRLFPQEWHGVWSFA